MKIVSFIVTLCAFHPQILGLSSLKKKITAQMSWPLKTYCINNLQESTEPHRRVGFQYIVASELQQKTGTKEEMRTKIYRLMNEMVHDVEMKIRNAEDSANQWIGDKSKGLPPLVKLGYLKGNIEIRYDVFMGIYAALQRSYHDWNAIEHVNAFEQTVNVVIELERVIQLYDQTLDEYKKALNKKALEDAKSKTEKMKEQLRTERERKQEKMSDFDKMQILQNEISEAISKNDYKRAQELQKLRGQFRSDPNQRWIAN